MYFFIFAAYAAMYTIAPESFPTQTRGIGMGIANVAARIGGIISPYITGILLEYSNGFEMVVFLYSSCFTVTGVIFLLLKETKLKAY